MVNKNWKDLYLPDSNSLMNHLSILQKKIKSSLPNLYEHQLSLFEVLADCGNKMFSHFLSAISLSPNIL